METIHIGLDDVPSKKINNKAKILIFIHFERFFFFFLENIQLEYYLSAVGGTCSNETNIP